MSSGIKDRGRGAKGLLIVCGLAFVLVLAAPAAAQSARAVSAELKALHDADQADREALGTTETWAEVAAADSVRLARVEAILGAGLAATGADLYHAALVFQHGDTAYDVWRAYDLSRRAVEDHGYEPARWLVPRGYDRWLRRVGRPQVYGTQFLGVAKEGQTFDADHDDDLVWSLGEADLDAVSDEERAVWGVRSAAETRALVECLNTDDGDFDTCDPDDE